MLSSGLFDSELLALFQDLHLSGPLALALHQLQENVNNDINLGEQYGVHRQHCLEVYLYIMLEISVRQCGFDLHSNYLPWGLTVDPTRKKATDSTMITTALIIAAIINGSMTVLKL